MGYILMARQTQQAAEKRLLGDPIFRERLLSGERIRGGDLPPNVRRQLGLQGSQTIRLRPAKRKRIILREVAEARQLEKTEQARQKTLSQTEEALFTKELATERRRRRVSKTLKPTKEEALQQASNKALQEALEEAQSLGLLAGKSEEIQETRREAFEAARPERVPFGERFLQSPVVAGILQSLGFAAAPPSEVTQTVPTPDDQITKLLRQGFSQSEAQELLKEPRSITTGTVPTQTPSSQINQALRQGFSPEAVQDTLGQTTDRIPMSHPDDGRPVFVKASQLKAAIKEGFKPRDIEERTITGSLS